MVQKIFRHWQIAKTPLVILLGSLALSSVLTKMEFHLFEASLYDLRMSTEINASPSENIVAIGVDDPSAKSLGEFIPLNIEHHARFLEKLEELRPKAIGYIVDFSQVYQNNSDQYKGEWSDRFVQSAQRILKKGTPFLIGTQYDVTGEVAPPFPISNLPHSIAIIHKDGNVFAEDKVTRRALTYLYQKPVFHLELANQIFSHPKDFRPKGSFYLPEIEGEYSFFRYYANPANFQNQDSKNYSYVSFIDVLSGSVPTKAIEGKIVLISTLSKENSNDFTYTPYSRTAFSSPKLLVHANILDSMIKNNGIVRIPEWINILVTFCSTLFVFWWVLNSSPIRGVIATILLTAVFLIVGQLLFSVAGIWLKQSQPLVGIFLGYYLTVPYRLIIEYKTRWNLQKRNEILIQVEELKTNFMSLITHDLRTPVARIRGLAEVLLRKNLVKQHSLNTSHLEVEDTLEKVKSENENIRDIIQSTDDLNQFITSILELTKIESNRLHLNLQSKDLNQLIERSIVLFSERANQVGVKIVSHLEPLFPIKIDPQLISKVINNIIDNALKYSVAGENKYLTITTKELDGFVELTIKDEGIGMTQEEIKNLFTKFYRAKNDLTTQIAGTGLGLYLTRYFIELHRGRVEVFSEKNKGTEMKIYLPIDFDSNINVTVQNKQEETIHA